MYAIGVCDDKEIIRSGLSKEIKKIAAKLAVPIHIELFNSGEEVYDFLKADKNLDLLFLDIELYELSGADLGLLIRNAMGNERLQIVYISGSERHAMKLFESRPLNFLVKPIDTVKLQFILEKAFFLNHQVKVYGYKTGHTSKKVPVNDVLYFEAEGRKIKIVTMTEADYFYGKIDEVSDELADCLFLRIHNSILVNYHNIIEFSYDYVILSNHSKLMISQSYRKEVRHFQMKVEEALNS